MSAGIQRCGTAQYCANCARIIAAGLEPPPCSLRSRIRYLFQPRKLLLSSFLVLLGLSGITTCSRHATAPEDVHLNTALHSESSKEWNSIVVKDFQWHLQGYGESDDEGIIITAFYSFTVKNRYAKESFELRFQLQLLDAEGIEKARHQRLVKSLSGTSERLVSGSFEFETDNLKRVNRSARMLVELL